MLEDLRLQLGLSPPHPPEVLEVEGALCDSELLLHYYQVLRSATTAQLVSGTGKV